MPICVLAEIQFRLIEIILRQFQILPGPKFNCSSSKLFQDNSNFCHSRNSSAPHRYYSKTFPNCVSAEIQFRLIEIILRQFHIFPEPIFNCPSWKLFQDNANLCLSRSSNASHRNCSKTILNCVVTEIQLPLIEILLRQFQNVS